MIFINAILVRDMIPVRFTNEHGQSEGAMYDRVSGQLFRNVGTGTFTIGPDKTSWTNPYITDGLVAMWDGEWNAGGGVHDANYSGWKNIVTGNDATLYEGTVQFDFNSAVFDGSTSLVVPDADFAPMINANNVGDVEVDALFRVTYDTNKNAVSVAGVGYTFLTMVNFYHSLYSYNGNQSNIRGYHADIQITGGMEIIPLYSWNRDGLVWAEDKRYGSIRSVAQGSTTISAGSKYYLGKAGIAGNKLIGNIYCIRLYSRALTDDERNANYVIDKERFNLL